MNKIAKKLAVGVVAISTAASLSGVAAFVPVAGAQTIAELQAMIAQLTAQIAALSGGSTGGACDATLSGSADMTIGSNGAAVTALQNYLTGTGHFTFAGGATGYFGPITQTALAAWQTANGVSPAAGYWGPISRSTYSANCGTGTGSTGTGSTGSTMLSGHVGDITLTLRGAYSAEEVGEGEDDVPVMLVDVEADDDSDVRIDSVKVEFHQATAADDRDLPDYASDVTVWFDGKKVGSADADDFSEGTTNYFTKSISLDNVVVKAGKEEGLTFAVSALNNLDSGDIDTDDWRIDLLSVRFTDGDGVTTTETGSVAGFAAAGTYGQTFDFASFATANDAELKVGLEDDSINDAHVLDVDDNDDTKHEVLSFYLDASGDSDIWIDEIPVVFLTTGETNESTLLVNATLYIDGEQVGATEDVPDAGAVTFDDLDYWLDAGDKVEAIVEVKVQDTDGAADNGDTVKATLTTASITAEDESGESVTATGSAAGDAHTMYDQGIMVEFISAEKTNSLSSETSGIDDWVEFTMKLSVTAFGDDMYIEDTCATEDDGTWTTAITVYLEGDSDFDNTTCSDISGTGDDKTSSWEVRDGDTETITIVYRGSGAEGGTNGTATTYVARIAGIAYTSGAAGNGDTAYNFSLADYKSSAYTVYDRTTP